MKLPRYFCCLCMIAVFGITVRAHANNEPDIERLRTIAAYVDTDETGEVVQVTIKGAHVSTQNLSALGLLKSLRSLTLTDSTAPLSDATISAIGKIESLQRLTFLRVKFAEDVKASSVKSMLSGKRLKTLRFIESQVEKSWLPELKDCSSLTHLCLHLSADQVQLDLSQLPAGLRYIDITSPVGSIRILNLTKMKALNVVIVRHIVEGQAGRHGDDDPTGASATEAELEEVGDTDAR